MRVKISHRTHLHLLSFSFTLVHSPFVPGVAAIRTMHMTFGTVHTRVALACCSSVNLVSNLALRDLPHTCCPRKHSHSFPAILPICAALCVQSAPRACGARRRNVKATCRPCPCACRCVSAFENARCLLRLVSTLTRAAAAEFSSAIFSTVCPATFKVCSTF